MNLDTPRLSVLALKPDQLGLIAHDVARFERETRLVYEAQPLDGFFGELLSLQAQVAREHGDDYLWHTFWLIVLKRSGAVVGTIDFKGAPDKNGAVELGYGLGATHEHHGYMTEAVRALCAWGVVQPGVTKIVAETEPDNASSEAVLRRCGFEETSRDATTWWALPAAPRHALR